MKKISHLILARNKDSKHRVAAELELLFDFVFVAAIALAAVGLHHAIAEAHLITLPLATGLLVTALIFRLHSQPAPISN